MAKEIIMKVVLTVVGFIVTGVLGYLTAKVKNKTKNEKLQNAALQALLKSQLTNTYFVYNELKKYLIMYIKISLICYKCMKV